MSTRTRKPFKTDDEDIFGADGLSNDLMLEDVTDDDIAAFIEEREPEKRAGFWNLPTVAGMSIITVGVAYLLQRMGLSAIPDFGTLVAALPWFAGALIILLGFGVLSWSPSRKKRRSKRRGKAAAATVAETEPVSTTTPTGTKTKRRLSKSITNKKLAGVCGGLAEYFGIDATLVRIGFVIATIFGGGFPAIPLYIVLAIIMSNPAKRKSTTKTREDRIRVIRD